MKLFKPWITCMAAAMIMAITALAPAPTAASTTKKLTQKPAIAQGASAIAADHLKIVTVTQSLNESIQSTGASTANSQHMRTKIENVTIRSTAVLTTNFLQNEPDPDTFKDSTWQPAAVNSTTKSSGARVSTKKKGLDRNRMSAARIDEDGAQQIGDDGLIPKNRQRGHDPAATGALNS